MRLAAVLMLALSPACLHAGICPADPAPRNDFQLFAGYSPYSPTLIGTETDRRFVLAGIEYSYRCFDLRYVAVSFAAGLMPLAIVLQPVTYAAILPPGVPVAIRIVPAHAVYGFGVTPIGGTFDFARRRALHPFLEFGLGVIASAEPVPENVPNATGLNFLVIFGGGVKVKRITLGYKFVHFSNANTTNFNPGLDNGVFYAGYSFVR